MQAGAMGTQRGGGQDCLEAPGDTEPFVQPGATEGWGGQEARPSLPGGFLLWRRN